MKGQLGRGVDPGAEDVEFDGNPEQCMGEPGQFQDVESIDKHNAAAWEYRPKYMKGQEPGSIAPPIRQPD